MNLAQQNHFLYVDETLRGRILFLVVFHSLGRQPVEIDAGGIVGAVEINPLYSFIHEFMVYEHRYLTPQYIIDFQRHDSLLGKIKLDARARIEGVRIVLVKGIREGNPRSHAPRREEADRNDARREMQETNIAHRSDAGTHGFMVV